MTACGTCGYPMHGRGDHAPDDAHSALRVLQQARRDAARVRRTVRTQCAMVGAPRRHRLRRSRAAHALLHAHDACVLVNKVAAVSARLTALKFARGRGTRGRERGA